MRISMVGSEVRRLVCVLLVSTLLGCGGGGGGAGSGSIAPTSGEVRLLAGRLPNAGDANGAATTALFRLPEALVEAPSGEVFVADTANHTIRRIAPDGSVSLFAGTSGVAGSADGWGTRAQFSSPVGLALDSAGNLYVADSGNHTIRKIDASGVVSTYAGVSGDPGAINGPRRFAHFDQPRAMAFDSFGNLYVGDRSGAVRRIQTDETVVTFAGALGVQGVAGGNGTDARFTTVSAIAVDEADNVIVAENDPGSIITFGRMRRFDRNAAALPWGSAPDGLLSTPSPMGIAVRAGGEVIVASGGVFVPSPSFGTVHSAILRVSADGSSSVLAGESSRFGSGSADGPGATARFFQPRGVALGSGGRILVADTRNNVIRQLDTSGNVATLAGTASIGSANGLGTQARFFSPEAIAAMPDGTLFIADVGNTLVRRMTASGEVSTQAFTIGSSPPAVRTSNGLLALGTSSDGWLYVSRSFSATVMDIMVSDAAGNARSMSGHVAFDLAGAPDRRVYFTASDSIQVANQDGTTATLMPGWRARALAADAGGTLYAAGFDHTIRVVQDGSSRILAGAEGQAGTADGIGAGARFDLPMALAVDGSGNVFVADRAGLRSISPSGRVTTLRITESGTNTTLRQTLPGGVRGLAWDKGILYATVENAVLAVVLGP